MIVAGIIVDAARMSKAKRDWDELMEDAQAHLTGNVAELKARDLYQGNDKWRRIDGGERNDLMENIITWMANKRHKLTFGAVSRQRLEDVNNNLKVEGLQDLSTWTVAAMHVVLSVQKCFQGGQKSKGNTVLVFDKATKLDELTELVISPPEVMHGFYGKERNQTPLDQIVDVPYSADSRHVGLIQVADFFAYIIRLHGELQDGIADEKFDGEAKRLEGWIRDMKQCFLKDSMRWPQGSKDPCTQFLRAAAPQSLLRITS